MQNLNNKILYTFVLMILAVPFLGRAGLVPCDGPNCDFSSLVQLVNNIIDFVITISISVSAIMFAYAGFLYITSQGSSGQLEKAHSIFKNVAIGLIFILGAWLIVKAIVLGLGADGSYLGV